jgi:hypothetical protein
MMLIYYGLFAFTIAKGYQESNHCSLITGSLSCNRYNNAYLLIGHQRMQSYLQYRRLREDIQKDLAASQHVIQSSDASNTAKKEKDSVTGKTSSDQPQVPGVTVSNSKAGDDSVIFVVGWKENDPNNPQCWPMVKKWTVMVTCCILAIALTIPTSVEGPVQEAFDQHFHVNAMAGSMSTGKANALICECVI